VANLDRTRPGHPRGLAGHLYWAVIRPFHGGVFGGMQRNVARADLQRDQEVGERRRQRHDDEEHHRRSVHGEDLVVLARREDLAVRLGELRTDEKRLETTDEEEEQRGAAVEDPDALVVDGGEPRAPAVRAGGSRERAERMADGRLLTGGELEYGSILR